MKKLVLAFLCAAFSLALSASNEIKKDVIEFKTNNAVYNQNEINPKEGWTCKTRVGGASDGSIGTNAQGDLVIWTCRIVRCAATEAAAQAMADAAWQTCHDRNYALYNTVVSTINDDL